MNRREFLKLSALAAGTVFFDAFDKASKAGRLFARENAKYDLAAVKNANPEKLFDEGIKALGGMTKFVRKGQKVLIKPNCAQPLGPEYGSNTNPLLIKRIIEHARDAGASKIYVTDHSLSEQDICFSDSGIGAVCRKTGAIIVPADDKKYYQEKTIPGAKRLLKTGFHEIFLEADTVINVPILKHHASTQLTMAMKNLMGIVWDRWFFHSNDLHQCIADLSLYRKPDLNVLDAYYVLTSHGPRGGNKSYVKTMKTQILSADIVATDAAGAKLFGTDPREIEFIKKGHAMKAGTMTLENLNIARISL